MSVLNQIGMVGGNHPIIQNNAVNRDMNRSLCEYWIPVQSLGYGSHGRVILCIPRQQMHAKANFQLFAVKTAHIGEPLSGRTSIAWEKAVMLNLLSDPRCPANLIPKVCIATKDPSEHRIATEHIRGITLGQLEIFFQEHVRKCMPASFAYYMLMKLWQALEFVHNPGQQSNKAAIAHADLVPENIMIDLGDVTDARSMTEFPSIRIIDWGNACAVGANHYSDAGKNAKEKNRVVRRQFFDCVDTVSLFHGVAHGIHGSNNRARHGDDGGCLSPCRYSGMPLNRSDTFDFTSEDPHWMNLLFTTRSSTPQDEWLPIEAFMSEYGEWLEHRYQSLHTSADVQIVWNACLRLLKRPRISDADIQKAIDEFLTT